MLTTTTSHGPDYRVAAKRVAQQKNIELWRKLSGRKQFFPKEQYWTLMDRKSFELRTLIESDALLSRSQFHGVNSDLDNYLACQRSFTGIKTYHGDWIDVLRTAPVCPSGGIVYLDTTSQLDDIRPSASTLLTATLEKAGPRTLVCANFCYDNPYRTAPVTFQKFTDRVLDNMTTASKARWRLISDGSKDCWLPARTRRIQMVTLFFWSL